MGFDNNVIFGSGLDLTNDQPNISNQLATDGFLYIGNSAGRPLAALPTSSDSSVTFTGGNGSLDAVVNTSGIPTVATTYQADLGSATPVSNVLDVLGGVGTNTVASGNDVTVHADGSGSLGAKNLALFYSAGTATIKGADGNNLSASNPGYVTIRSNVTEGVLVTYTITSNFTFDDANGAASVFAGSLFGFTTGDTTTGDRKTPFYLYAVGKDDDTDFSFFISRYPSLGQSVSNTTLSLKDAASGNADTYRDTLALEVLGASLSNFDAQNSTMIGVFEALINGSDDWVIQSLASITGIGRTLGFNNQVHSKGVMGQATNSYFLANGGTAPTDTDASNNMFQYRIDEITGTAHIIVDTIFQGSPTGAVDAIINVPIQGPNADMLIELDGTLIVSGNYYPVKLRQVGTTVNTTQRQFYLYKADGTTARWQYSEFSNGDRLLITDTYFLR